MIVRRLLVAMLAVLLALQVVRTAAVGALAESRPEDAARLWPSHPSVETSLGMIAIAEAARDGRAVAPETFGRIFDASAKAPLAPEPFLVRGVQAQLAGDTDVAERAFRAAQRRDGRSLPARYFLADLYLRKGDARPGLAQIAVLARLVPDGANKLAPYVATYARDRANWPSLRALFRAEPYVEDASLAALSADAANADAVLALSDPARRSGKLRWLPILMGSLGDAGQYAKARNIWSTVARAPLAPGSLIFDPRFTEGEAPPPFNWTLAASTVGLAERLPGRGLHVIYYGQEDGVLASQLLVLPPGQYRLGTDAPSVPDSAASLSWRLVCARGNEVIASVPLDQAIRRGWRFAAPSSCPAQRLELVGSSSDVARQTDAAIRSIRLEREQARG